MQSQISGMPQLVCMPHYLPLCCIKVSPRVNLVTLGFSHFYLSLIGIFHAAVGMYSFPDYSHPRFSAIVPQTWQQSWFGKGWGKHGHNLLPNITELR